MSFVAACQVETTQQKIVTSAEAKDFPLVKGVSAVVVAIAGDALD